MQDPPVKMKKQTTDWGEIFANHVLIRDSSKLNSEDKQSNQKTEENHKRHFAEEEIWMANKHMKTCSTPLATREMKIMTTIIIYHYTASRSVKIKNIKCQQG